MICFLSSGPLFLTMAGADHSFWDTFHSLWPVSKYPGLCLLLRGILDPSTNFLRISSSSTNRPPIEERNAGQSLPFPHFGWPKAFRPSDVLAEPGTPQHLTSSSAFWFSSTTPTSLSFSLSYLHCFPEIISHEDCVLFHIYVSTF